jgi:hypothetical protein
MGYAMAQPSPEHRAKHYVLRGAGCLLMPWPLPWQEQPVPQPWQQV